MVGEVVPCLSRKSSCEDEQYADGVRNMWYCDCELYSSDIMVVRITTRRGKKILCRGQCDMRLVIKIAVVRTLS